MASGVITCYPVYGMDIAENEQASEIEDYLIEKGAKDIQSSEEGDMTVRLRRIIEHCHVVFSGNNAAESEGLLYGILTLLHLVPGEDAANVLDMICKQLTSSANKENGHVIIKLMMVMLTHLPEQDRRGLNILKEQLSLTSKLQLGNLLHISMETVRHRVKCWNLSNIEKQDLYLLLWDIFQDTNRSLANKFLVEGFRHCSSVNDAAKLKEPAEKLLINAIQDSSHFVMDYLLELQPIRALQGTTLCNLLQIIVSGNYSDYMKFYEMNKVFFESHDLDHASCQHKMRLLTMMSLSNETNELSFDVLQNQLELKPEEIESFIVDAVKMGLIQAKINQVSRLVIIIGGAARYRTFGMEQWKLMHSKLVSWRNNITSVHTSLKSLTVST